MFGCSGGVKGGQGRLLEWHDRQVSLPDHGSLAFKKGLVVANPGGDCEVVLAGNEIEDACCPVSHQQSILQHRQTDVENQCSKQVEITFKVSLKHRAAQWGTNSGICRTIRRSVSQEANVACRLTGHSNKHVRCYIVLPIHEVTCNALLRHGYCVADSILLSTLKLACNLHSF